MKLQPGSGEVTDGYTIWLTRDDKRARSNFKVLLASCRSKYFYYETFWMGKNLSSLSYLQTVLTTLTEYNIKENLISPDIAILQASFEY